MKTPRRALYRAKKWICGSGRRFASSVAIDLPAWSSHAVGIVVSVEHSSAPWQPRVRVRFDNYLSGWIWSHLLARASEFP